jgi:hypothetical protein
MEGVTSASDSYTLFLPPSTRRPQAQCRTILPSLAPFTGGLVFTPVGGVVRSRRRGVGITRPSIPVSCTLLMSIPTIVVHVSQCPERRIPQIRAHTIVDHHIEPSYSIFPLPFIDLPRDLPRELERELPRDFERDLPRGSECDLLQKIEQPSTQGFTRFVRDRTDSGLI